MGRGVLAAAGGSGGNPFLMTKRSKNILLTLQGMFFERFSTFFEGAGMFFECFLKVLEKLLKDNCLTVLGQILESQYLAGDAHHKPFGIFWETFGLATFRNV